MAVDQTGLVSGLQPQRGLTQQTEPDAGDRKQGRPIVRRQAGHPFLQDRGPPLNLQHFEGSSQMRMLHPAGRAKALAEALEAILQRLGAEAPELRYPSAAALLDDLDRVSGDVPANPEAWERLLRYVRENAQEERRLRQSA